LLSIWWCLIKISYQIP